MALSWQTALANEPVPEPSSPALVENVKILQNKIIQTIGAENSDLVIKVWAGALGIAIIWVGLSLSAKRNRRSGIKSQILEISERLKAHLTQFPEAFIKQHAVKVQQTLSELEALNNKEIDEIINKWGHKLRHFERKIRDINSAIINPRKWEKDTRGELKLKYDDVRTQEDKLWKDIADEIKSLKKKQEEYKNEWYLFQEPELPLFQTSFDIKEMRLSGEQVIRSIRKTIDDLNGMRSFYSGLSGMEVQVQKEWGAKNDDLSKICPDYKKICDRKNMENWRDMEKQIKDFIKDFQIAFPKKDIKKLTELSNSKNMIIALMRDYMIQLKNDITEYQDVLGRIPSKLKSLYTLQQYWSAPGKSLPKADIRDKMISLYDILPSIRLLHEGRQNIWVIRAEFAKFDRLYEEMQDEMEGRSQPDQSISEQSDNNNGPTDFQATEPMQY